jgi:hypothetical protein
MPTEVQVHLVDCHKRQQCDCEQALYSRKLLAGDYVVVYDEFKFSDHYEENKLSDMVSLLVLWKGNYSSICVADLEWRVCSRLLDC